MANPFGLHRQRRLLVREVLAVMRPWEQWSWKIIGGDPNGQIVVNTDQERRVREAMQSGMSQEQAVRAVYGVDLRRYPEARRRVA